MGIKKEVTLLCTVDAYPQATLKWTVSGTEIAQGTVGYVVSRSGDTLYLKITMSDASRRGKYVCVAKNDLGKTEQEYEIRPKGKLFKGAACGIPESCL